MTALKAHEVARFLQRPDLDEGIFLAYGPDAGLVSETAKTLAKRLAGTKGQGTEVLVFEGSELDAEPSLLAIEAKTQSMFGDKRIIRVRGATKSLLLTLTELRDDPQGAVIILEAGNLLPKDALRAFVEAAKSGRALPCYPDTDESLSALIRETFNQNGIRVDADVLPALRGILGNDREVTRRELEKLTLFAASSKELTLVDVMTLCADNAALVMDEIIDATGTGHAQKLDDALNRAFAAAVDPQRLLAVSLNHFSGLRRLRGEVDAGRSPRDVLESARPRPHFSRKAAMEQQLRLWSDGALANACERLQDMVAESRRKPALAEALLRRSLLALATMAAGH
ncbi:MAG TPA: DNA polymerase III subunit delta [Devosiaceae bacterium]|jgi:DNA polymerase-3 subunit delta